MNLSASLKDEKNYSSTNSYALIDAINSLRISNGLPAYIINPILMSVAQQHADYMASTGKVDHIGINGSKPFQRGLAAGYPVAGDLSQGGFYSENITAGINKSVQDAVVEWQGDTPHLKTMLSPNLSEIGAGATIIGSYVYFVIDCASPTLALQPQVYTPVPGNLSGTKQPLTIYTLVPVTPGIDGKVIHVVKPGETLWLIAITYGVKVATLRGLNNLSEEQNIFPGDKLLIKQVPTPALIGPTLTVTIIRDVIHLPTITIASIHNQPSATPKPAADVLPNSNKEVLLGIVIAAMCLAVFFVRVKQKNE